VARELHIPWGTFHRYVSWEENSGIRVSIEEIFDSNDERSIPEGYRIEDDHYIFEISISDEPYRIHREVWEQVCSSRRPTTLRSWSMRAWSSVSGGSMYGSSTRNSTTSDVRWRGSGRRSTTGIS
jgi:hypothetical protein